MVTGFVGNNLAVVSRIVADKGLVVKYSATSSLPSFLTPFLLSRHVSIATSGNLAYLNYSPQLFPTFSLSSLRSSLLPPTLYVTFPPNLIIYHLFSFNFCSALLTPLFFLIFKGRELLLPCSFYTSVREGFPGSSAATPYVKCTPCLCMYIRMRADICMT